MIEILPVEGMPEVTEGDDIAALVASRAALRDGDVVVVTQKIVSKAEGRVVAVDPADDAERARWIASETKEVLARRGDLTIARTRHGFVCANAGVDASNVPAGSLALLPLDPDASAAAIRDRLRAIAGVNVAVVVTDTFGRPWRDGQTDVAIGSAGIAPLRDHVGQTDAFGNELRATRIAVVDEIAGAAELVMGKALGVPVAIVRGVPLGDETARTLGTASLVRAADEDLFPTGRAD